MLFRRSIHSVAGIISLMLILPLLFMSLASSALSPDLRDVTYCIADGIDLKMDIYFPSATWGKPRPATVYVHGGAWIGGDKRDGAGILEIPELLLRGYVVAAINYRLAPKYKFPAQIEDVKCAIRSLRANAATYRIDPDRIGVWGGSAGGHLVSLLGLTDRSAGFDVGQHLDQSSRVQAVVDYFGPSNLTDFQSGSLPQLLMVFGSKEGLRKASPVTYITSDDPPFLIVQGELDTLVPPEQSQELYRKLTAAGLQATLVMVKNAGHGFRPVDGPISPSRAEITKMTADFFDKHLQRKETQTSVTQTWTSQTVQTQTLSPTTTIKPLLTRLWVYAVVSIVVAVALIASVIVIFRRRK